MRTLWSSDGSHEAVRELLKQAKEWGFIQKKEYESHHLVAKSAIYDLITTDRSSLTKADEKIIADRLPAVPLLKKVHEQTSDYKEAVVSSDSIERVRQREVFKNEGYDALFEDRCQDTLRAAKIFQIPDEVIDPSLESARQYKEVIKPVLENHVKRVSELAELNKALCQGKVNLEAIPLYKSFEKPELGSGNTSQTRQAKELSVFLDKLYERDFQQTSAITQQQKQLTAQGQREEAWLTQVEHIKAFFGRESSQIITHQESVLLVQFGDKLDDGFKQRLENRQELVRQHGVDSPKVANDISKQLKENEQVLKDLSEKRKDIQPNLSQLNEVERRRLSF